jgi:hypothetical protein
MELSKLEIMISLHSAEVDYHLTKSRAVIQQAFLLEGTWMAVSTEKCLSWEMGYFQRDESGVKSLQFGGVLRVRFSFSLN